MLPDATGGVRSITFRLPSGALRTILRPMRRVLIAALVVIPGVALALNFSEVQYVDAPFSVAEDAAISLLTPWAVQGNPDGTFAPRRTLNRAEFLKIALLTRSGGMPIQADTDAGDCFPDIRPEDWFAQFVCHAKENGVVGGYPDGFFHPERPVNYAEAVKMLVNAFNYGLEPSAAGEQWYAPFMTAAAARKVLLPLSITPADPLTRGQMARLAAAFLADSTGELTAYRDAERGIREGGSSSSGVSSAQSVLSSSTPVSSSAASQQSSTPLFPARRHQLLIGQMTPAIFDGVFQNSSEDAVVRSVKLTLAREIKSIQSLWLTDGSGTPVGQLLLDINNNDARTKWIGNFGTGTFVLPKNQSVLLGFRAMLKDRANGGGSKEMFEVADQNSFSLYAEGSVTHTLRQLFPASPHSPFSETAQARMETVTNTLPDRATITAGPNRTIASFSFGGTVLSGATLQLQALTFHILSQHGISVTGWRIGGPAEVQQAACGVDTADRTLISCSVIPDGFHTVGNPKQVIGLYGDVSIDQSIKDPSLQVGFSEKGKIGVNGDIWWGDGAGFFRWMEDAVGLPRGPMWSVK